MTEDSLEPLDPELQRLFAAEARFPAEPAATKARVWAGVEAGIAPTPPDGGGGADGGTSGATGAASGAGTGAGKLASVALAAFAAGGISGAAIYHASVEPPEPRVVQVPAPERSQLGDAGAGADGPQDDAGAAIAGSLASSDAGTGVQRPAAASALPERRRSPARTRADRPATEDPPAAEADRSQLARERAIIEVARAGIARGHPASALSALDRHAREFPHGRLAEERDGLRIIALAKAGRSSEAENEAVRFRDRYPNSLLQPAIEAALGSGP